MARFFNFYCFVLIFCTLVLGEDLPCVPKPFEGSSSIVCVCNSTYCDKLSSIEKPSIGEYLVVTSSQDGLRFHKTRGSMGTIPGEDSENRIQINVLTGSRHYQEIIGFGGAFTDATGHNLNKQNQAIQDIVIEQYFGKNGLEYNIGRVPMGGADFSTRPYTYDDIDNGTDTGLEFFSLQEEDRFDKMRFMRRALQLKPDLKLFASVWTAPKWMKSNNDFIGLGRLKPEYYGVWANYFIRFLEEYLKEGFNFWAITTQNEPLHGEFFDYGFNCMGWTATQQKEWIKKHLGPTIEASQFKDIKIMMFDDQRLHLKEYTEEILADPEAAKYISGIGVHWYTDAFIPPDILSQTHYNFPQYFILGTEACSGAMPNAPDVILGSWERAANYASDIMHDLNNFVAGWVDWNLVLDEQGGPNWAENYVDAPIISDPINGQIYKQPIFYALGHITKFLPENSVRVKNVIEMKNITGVQVVTFLRPDETISVVLLNRRRTAVNVTIADENGTRGYIHLELLPNSISSLVYNPWRPAAITSRPSVSHASGSSSTLSVLQFSSTMTWVAITVLLPTLLFQNISLRR